MLFMTFFFVVLRGDHQAQEGARSHGEKQRPTTISEAGESNHGRRAKADNKQASTPFNATVCGTNGNMMRVYAVPTHLPQHRYMKT